MIATRVGREVVEIEVEVRIPGGQLCAQVGLGLIHLAGDRLEVGIVDLGQGLDVLEGQGSQRLDAHLLHLGGQSQRGGCRQALQSRIESRGRREQHGGIGFRPRADDGRSQRQGHRRRIDQGCRRINRLNPDGPGLRSGCRALPRGSDLGRGSDLLRRCCRLLRSREG